MNTVEVYHNPYRTETKILVNGKMVSAYSSLSRFCKEPFLKWCTELCEQIAEELNDDYELIFSSGEYEMDIMERLCADCPSCRKYRSVSPQLSLPTAKRLRLLSRFLRNNRVQNFRKTVIHVDCTLFPSCAGLAEQIRQLEIRNLFCEAVFHIRTFGQALEAEKRTWLVFAKIGEREQVLQALEQSGKAAFLLLEGKSRQFLEKRGSVLVYEFVKEEPEQSVFDVMLMEPLCRAFRDCKSSLPPVLFQNPECRVLDAMEPELEAGPPCQVEKGYKIPLVYHIYPPEASVPLEFVVDDPQIAACDSRQITGRDDGDTRVRICHARTKEELGSIPIHVFRTNHISSIVLEERTAVIPIGGTVRLGYHFAPKDADNIDQLCWSADVPGGISVDRRGVVLGLSPGRYRIRLQAGSVSDEGVILVKEKLRGLWLSAERLELTRGEWSSVSYIGEPEDCYPEPIYTYIEDKTVISYADNTVYAEQAGETDLVFYNSSRSVEKRCHIVVREKASEKNDKGKPGLLHGLWDTLAPGKRK